MGSPRAAGRESGQQDDTNFSYRLCRNHAFDKAMDAQVKNAKDCTTSFDDLGGGKFSSRRAARSGTAVIVSKGTYTYESATSTRSESHATYTPAFNGKTEETLLQDQPTSANARLASIPATGS